MSRMDTRERMSDDGRFELSFAAMSHERRNRPRGFVVLAAIAVVVSVLFAGYGISARGKARSEHQRAVADLVSVEAAALEWRQLEDLERDPNQRIGRPNPLLLSRMEELAVQAGLDRPRQPRMPQPEQRGGITITQYHYGDTQNPITHASLSALLEWVRLAQGEELGMELIGLNLRPDATNWRMTVIFRRWERSS